MWEVCLLCLVNRAVHTAVNRAGPALCYSAVSHLSLFCQELQDKKRRNAITSERFLSNIIQQPDIITEVVLSQRYFIYTHIMYTVFHVVLTGRV